nr:hypothetical protein [Massilia sp. JS1662]
MSRNLRAYPCLARQRPPIKFINMVRFFVFVFFALFSAAVAACDSGALAELPKFWHAFHQASLHDNAESVSNFYRFPLEFKGPYSDDKSVVLDRATFLKNYEFVFREGIIGEGKSLLLKNLEEKPQSYWNDQMAHAVFPGKKCMARIDDYEMMWNDGKGWKIIELYYVENFSLLKSYLKKSSK